MKLYSAMSCTYCDSLFTVIIFFVALGKHFLTQRVSILLSASHNRNNFIKSGCFTDESISLVTKWLSSWHINIPLSCEVNSGLFPETKFIVEILVYCLLNYITGYV